MRPVRVALIAVPLSLFGPACGDDEGDAGGDGADGGADGGGVDGGGADGGGTDGGGADGGADGGGDSEFWVAPSTVAEALDSLPPADLTAPGAPDPWLDASVLEVMARALDFGITDPACPVVSGLHYSGGCTDAEGRTWWGEMTWDEEYGGTTEGFGHDREDGCWEFRAGTVSIEGSGMGTSYDLSLGIWTRCGAELTGFWAVEGGAGTGYVHELDAFPWSSNLRTGLSERGVATVADRSTHQAACALEPDSGTFSVQSDDHELFYTFDGASACDGLVPVTLDGVPQPAAAYP